MTPIRSEGERDTVGTVTLDQAIDVAIQLPPAQQEMLLDVLRSRRIEARRAEIAADARDAIAAYRIGQLETQSVEIVIAELRRSLEGPE
jgi:hypothetical protein